MFDPSEFEKLSEETVNKFFEELEYDLNTECSKFGEIKKLTVILYILRLSNVY